MPGTKLLGRDAEISVICRFLDALPDDATCLLLEGEAGIGKTSLLRRGVDKARELGYLVLVANPVEMEVPWEFSALADMLGELPQDALGVLPPAQRRAIGVAVLREEDPEIPVDPRTVATAVLALLRSLAGERPVVLVIDDLQLLDAPTAEVLAFALRRVGGDAIGLLATVRTDWSGDSPPLVTDAVGADQLQRVRVGPLELAATRDLLTSWLPQAPRRASLLRLHEITRGNPFYLHELIAGNTADQLDGLGGPSDVPVSLRRLVLGRIEAVSDNARDLLLVCALAGDPDVALVTSASVDSSGASDALQVLIREGLLRHDRGSVSFSHPLIRSVVIGEASSSERRMVHGRLAEAVRQSEARARHLALAASGPDEQRANELERAAVTAGGRGAYGTGATLAKLAAGLTPASNREDHHRRTALEAEFAFEALDPVRASMLLESIIDDVPPGVGRADLLRKLARYLAFRGDPTSSWIPRLKAALGESTDDPALQAAIFLELAVAASNTGDREGAVQYGERTLELVEHVGDKAREAQLCAGMAFAAFCGGGGVRKDLIERALSGAEQPPLLSVDLRPNVAVGHLLLLSDDLDGARSLYQQEYERALEEGLVTGLPLMLWGYALTEAWAGNWDRADQIVAEGSELARDSGCWVSASAMSAVSGLMNIYRGRVDEGRSECEHAMVMAEEAGLPLFVLIGASAVGLAELSVGDSAAAQQRLEAFVNSIRENGIDEPGIFRFLPDAIEALTRLGQIESAAELLDVLERRSSDLGRPWGVTSAARCRGLLLAGRGEFDEALSVLGDQLESDSPEKLPFEYARTLLVAGEVHRRAKHKSMAKMNLDQAANMFSALGAPLWEQKARDELSRLGLRATGRSAKGSELTEVEHQVADLVAGGMTNAEVAAQLFMAQRTVEAHLSRIYQKLGIRSRTQLSRLRPVRT